MKSPERRGEWAGRAKCILGLIQLEGGENKIRGMFNFPAFLMCTVCRKDVGPTSLSFH